jgi:type VI secretion system protein ImpA
MSPTELEALLNPITESEPCVKDLEYDPAFLKLQELARGKPEQVIGDSVKAAQDPPWAEVRDAATALFGSTKDLRVAAILHRALLKTDGVTGFANSVALIRNMLERYWPQVYPLLDAEDHDDATFRVNALVAALAGEDALITLRSTPLVESRQFGRQSLRHYRIGRGTLKVDPSEAGGADPAQVLLRLESAFQDADLAAMQSVATALASTEQHLIAIQKLLLDKADGIPEELTDLSTDVKEMKMLLETQLTRRGAGGESGAGMAADLASGTGGAPTGQSLDGDVRNRADVVRAIDKICDYYRRSEPASPVPMLLQRAKRLVNKDFMEIIRDLTPAGVAEAEVIGGLEKKDT